MLSIKLSENAGRAPEAVPFMPAGKHFICATVNGKPGRREVTVNREACERLQTDLEEHLRASDAGEKARPMLMFDHTAGNAAAKPLGFEWDDERGILLRVEWTKAGREAVEGGNYGYVSPAFRLAKGTGEILGLAGGVEVGSLVNDPAFEKNECIAAARTEEPEEVSVEFVETANPYGCNQYGHEWRSKHGENFGGVSKLAADKAGKDRFDNATKRAKQITEEYETVRKLWSGDGLGKKASKVGKLNLIREIWNRMHAAKKGIDVLLNDKTSLTEKEEEYVTSELEDLEKEMKRARKWVRRINSMNQSDELKAAFAELEQELNDEFVKASVSVPPRGKIEKPQNMVDNKDVADGGGNNNQQKKMEEIIKVLGLPPNADEAAVLAAIRAMKKQQDEIKKKTEAVEAECEQHKKSLEEHKEKSADAFIKRLQKNGTISPKDEEKAKAARTLYMTDPEQAETLFAGLRSVAAEVLSDKVHANNVSSDRTKSAAEILQDEFESNN